MSEILTIGLLIAILSLQIYRISAGMSREELQDQLDDLAGILSAMGHVFENLGELMPKYEIEVNPIAGAIQKALLSWLGVDETFATDLLTEQPSRDSAGRYDGPKESEEIPSPES